MPPAVFPVCLGLLGLGIGWRAAAEIIPLAFEIGGLLLGLAAAYFLFFLLFYLRKVLARPRVLFEDMKVPPARAGIAAAAMSMMLLAAALLPFNIYVPQVWILGVVLQIAASAVVCYAILKEPPEQRKFSPFQYLTFVGPVVGPVAGIPLGYVNESIWLTFAALAAYLIITVGYGLQLRHERPPARLRPSLVIFLAPNCLFALSFGQLGFDWAFHFFYWLANIVALGFVLLIPWLCKGGWTPVWASFTFPVAAFLNVQVLAVANGAGITALIGVYAGIAIATPLILFTAYRFVMLWVTGELAEITNAARA